MPFASALSQHPDVVEATAEVVGRVVEELAGVPDLALLFCSPHHVESVSQVAATVHGLVSPRVLLGTTTGTVVGRDREVEDGPAISLWAASLPVTPVPVRVTAARTPTGTAVQGLSVRDLPDGGTLLLLADPFSLPVAAVLDAIDAAGSTVAVAGGLASAASGPGGNRLVVGGDVVSSGAVGALLAPGSGASTVVSQGCRPVGEPMIVTAAEGNVLVELAGRPALERVAELAQGAGPDERQQLAAGLQLGVAIDEHRTTFGRGDFLVRGILAADRRARSLVVGEAIPVGTTIQFQVRDAATAEEDLREVLGPLAADGALLFTCNGRGTTLFDRPDHDARAVCQALGTRAVAGMSCAGELGPVGGRSFVHGFTASIVLFNDV